MLLLLWMLGCGGSWGGGDVVGKTGFLPSFITAGFGIFAEIALGPVIKFICKVFGNVIGEPLIAAIFATL